MLGHRSLRVIVSLLLALVSLTLLPGCFFPRKTAKPAGGVRSDKPAALRGVVTMINSSQPVVGAKVTLFNDPTVAMTDSSGRFEFASVPSGWQTVFVRKEGYLLGSLSLRLQGGQTGEASLMMQEAENHLHGSSLRVPGLCGACHQLHRQPLLKGATPNSSCFSCHSEPPAGFANPFFPQEALFQETYHSNGRQPAAGSRVKPTLPGFSYGRGECANCHEPHGITNFHPHLVRFAEATPSSNPLCYACHDEQGTGNTLDYPGPAACDASDNLHMHPTRQDMLYPDTSPNSTLQLRAGECYNCHDPHGAKDPVTHETTLNLVRDDGNALCLKCHTTWASQHPGSANTKHTCTMCHNPHLIKTGKNILMDPTDSTRRVVRSTGYYKARHRGNPAVIKNDFCLGCHKTGGPGKVPDMANTLFKNVANNAFLTGNPQYRDLHKVHIAGPIGVLNGFPTVGTYAWGGKRLRNCYPAGYGHETQGPMPEENKVWCVDCHDVHPSPTVAGNTRGKLLLTNKITRLDPLTSNANGQGYNGKNSCGMTSQSMCHQGAPSNGDPFNGCDWCHKSNVGSPGVSCECTTQCNTGGENGNWQGFGGHGYHHEDHGGNSPIAARRTVVLY